MHIQLIALLKPIELEHLWMIEIVVTMMRRFFVYIFINFFFFSLS